MSARSALRRLLRRAAADGASERPTVGSCLSDDERALVERCQPYSLAGPERLIATADAVEHVVRRDIAGGLLECGVWRGGSVLAMILTLQRLGVTDRDVYLCDTFHGMTAPTGADTSEFEEPAIGTFERARGSGQRAWGFLFGEEVFSRAQVEEMLLATGYPADRIHFVVGPVEETLPDQAPDTLALVRLDTDWYESTRHEMEHLYPRLSPGGVLIVDDYGHWQGAQRAVDEYFGEHGAPLLLARTDYTGRMAVKV